MQQVIRKLLAKKGSLLSRILFGVYTVILLLATLLPTDVISSGGKGWISKISFDNGDKVVHAALFFIFTFLLYLSGVVKTWRSLILISVFTGLTIEIVQHISSFGRTFDWFDILANIIGSFLAYLLFARYWKSF